MNWSSDSIEKLYGVFRRKMIEVYRKNSKPDPFSNSMVSEFNAWQNYLRNSLRLEVKDASEGERSGFVRDKDLNTWLKITNPSNGASFSNEFILVPSDLAEKAITLGDLPEEL